MPHPERHHYEILQDAINMYVLRRSFSIIQRANDELLFKKVKEIGRVPLDFPYGAASLPEYKRTLFTKCAGYEDFLASIASGSTEDGALTRCAMVECTEY